MRANEFLLIRDNIPVNCSALAVLYSDDSNRGFVVYSDNTTQNNKNVIKIGEILLEDDEVIIEDLKDAAEIEDVWNQFLKIYKNIIENKEK